MNKKVFANEDLMQDYFDGLLQEVQPEVQLQAKPSVTKVEKKQPLAAKPALDPVRHDVLNKLLDQVSLQTEPVAKSKPIETAKPVDTTKSEVTIKPVVTTKPQVAPETKPESIQKNPAFSVPESAFQALFFEVAGLTLAVPLADLGGIHTLEQTAPLFGKPDWFKGIMLKKEAKLNVVDTALWVMPEKYTAEMSSQIDYKYLIMLSDSHWGVACEKLVSTVTLQPSDVKWRGENSKRRWLAGLVRDKMCALLSVDELILLLNKGFNSRS